jgi:hypothetical protein
MPFLRRLPMNVDLRFADKDEEFRFVAHTEKKLVMSTSLFAVLAILAILISAPAEQERERAHHQNPYRFSAGDPRSLRFVISCVFVLACLLVIVLASLWCFGGYRLLNWEILYTSVTTAFMVALCIGNRWTIAKIYVQDPSETWVIDPRGAEGSLALSVDAITTITCLFVPVRMHLKWIPPVFGNVAFCVCFGVWGSPFPGALPVNTFKLFLLTCCALWGAWRNESEVRKNYLAQGIVHRKSHELEVQHAGASCILERLCDVLLELDSDFSICESSPRLAALLFHPSPLDLKARDFCNLIASKEDRLRFVNAMREDSPISSMVQLNLRDCQGREFGVYLHHARTFGIVTEKYGYLVALVEIQERAPPDASAEMSFTHVDTPASREVDHSESEASLPLVAEASKNIAAWIDAKSPGLEIAKCSAGFTVFGPIVSECRFVEMIANPQTFMKWMKLGIATKLTAETNPVSFDPIRLKIRTSPLSQSEFSANCRLDLESLDWDADADSIFVCLVFDEIKYRRLRRLDRNRFQQRVSPSPSETNTLAEMESLSHFELDDVAVSFLVEPGFPILSFSPAFTALAGPCKADQPLLDMIRERDSFSTWVQRIVDGLYVSRCYDSTLTLRTVTAQRSTVECRAENISLNQVIIDTKDDGGLFVVFRVTLKHIRQGVILKKKQTHRRGHDERRIDDVKACIEL